MSHDMSWLNMGGYAAYVWSAYGAVALVFVGHWWRAKTEQKRILKRLGRI